MCFLITMLTLLVGFYNMSVKETYKPKETNVKKLEVFLNKLEKQKEL